MSQVSTPTQVYEVEGNILIRTAEITDAATITDYFVRNKQHLKAWEPKREPEFFSVSGWTKKLFKLNELHTLGLGYYLLIFDTNTQSMLGTVSFSGMTRFPAHTCNVGYSMDKDSQGKGIMTRALKLAVNYMFDIQNMHRISAGYLPHNDRSGAVLNNVGFEREGYAKDYLLINGQWQDHVLTALTNPNWTANK